MFVRKKPNKSGSVSVQIIDKKNGCYQVVQTIGSSKDIHEIERFFLQGQQIIHAVPPGTQWLFPVKSKEELAVENFVANLSGAQVRTVGPELIFGSLFDRIGFNAIAEDLFRHVTIARLVYPASKVKTIDYLYRYRGVNVDVDAIYRFMDKLNSRYKDEVGAIAYRYTKKQLGTIAVVFYDMTSLYFEAEDEDDLRKIGYSKDGKFQNPQILLGLLVGEGGLPIGYDIFEGNTFEGHTLLPVLKKIQAKYGLDKPIVVADAALLSRQNLKSLEEEHYRFILGGRIKNESEQVKAEILKQARGIEDGGGFVLEKPDNTRLVVTYSCKRARKDSHNRRKGVKKLEVQVRSGRFTKQSINNRGYNKFLTIQGEAVIAIDEEKIKADERWDGLKGYITNTRLPAKKVAETYVHLWQIEKAFRISKTDLKVRPIHHYLRRRIEAHVCIAFVAYTIYKELERLLHRHGVPMSPARAAELTHTMYELEYTLPGSSEKKRQLLKMDEEQQLLYGIIHQ
ncbi:MAG: IS1634 family transposase [Patescibacteria group bacterium]